MHDMRAIRDAPVKFDAALARRGLPPASAELLAIDAERRGVLTAVEEKQRRRNALSKEIGLIRRDKGDAAALEREAIELREAVNHATEQTIVGLDRSLRDRLAELPNTLDPDVPDGLDESANLVVKQVAAPPAFAFPPRQHFELGEALGMMDFEAAAKIAGSRFTVLRGALARLERALAQFMLDLHTTQHGYTEVQIPVLVNGAAMFGTGNLPKFADDAFHTTDDRWLIPTSEVAMTNLVAGDLVPAAQLPIRTTALSDCFRSEAGSAGRDTRGMLRQHQFRKVELVSITHPDASDREHERMTVCAEAVLIALHLPFRRMMLCAGDTTFGAAKTYDLEVWLPGQGAWREISSCSNMRAFQARRMNARVRGPDGKAAGFVHTLNGSGLAVGRALIAVMETYQQADGSIQVPEVLLPYMGGMTSVQAAGTNA